MAAPPPVLPATAPPNPPGNSSEMDKWVHEAFGIHPADYAKPSGGSSGAQQPGAASIGPAGNDQQSQEFRAALEQELTAINDHLAYTADHAEPTKHQPMVARSQAIANAYQPAIAQIDPADPAKAKGAIDKVLADARALRAEVAQFRQAAEKAFNDWQSRQPKYDQAVKQIAEMQAWGHAKAPSLQAIGDSIRSHLDGRAYAEACTAFDQLLPQLQPAYDDYQKQKAAQEQYEPLRKALDPRLADAAASTFHKLEPMQQEFGPATTEMDAAVTAKDYVRALQLVTNLADKVTAYETAVAELQKQKQEYDDEKAKLLPRLDEAKQAPPHIKFEPMLQDLTTGQRQMEASAQAEDFVAALATAKDLGAKADSYNAAVKELEEQKKAYEAAAAKVTPRIAAASQSKYKQLEQALTAIAGLQTQMEASAKEENYIAALDHANSLSSKLDDYEKLLQDLLAHKQRYEETRAALQPQLDAIARPPRAKLTPQVQTIDESMKAVDAAVADENYESAEQLVSELKAKVDDYEKALQDLLAHKQKYEEARAVLQPQLDAIVQSSRPKLAPQVQGVNESMKAADAEVADENYESAEQKVGELKAKLDNYAAAVKALDDEKKACTAAWDRVKPRLDFMEQSLAKTHEPMPEKIVSLAGEIEKAAQVEEYADAIRNIDLLTKELDSMEQRLPGGTIQGNAKPEDEEQKVMAGIAAARTLAITYLNGHKSEIIMATEAFKSAAQSEIDALDGDPSDLTGAVGPLLGLIGTVVSGIFPPAAGFVAGTVFVANMANASAIAGIKAEGGKAKQSLKDGMQAFATAVTNAANIAINAESNAIAPRLTDMAATDKNVWNMLATAGDRQLDNVVTQLHITDPAKQSSYGPVLKVLMSQFSSWLAKEKYELGKTGFDKKVAESIPSDPSFKELHKQMKDAESAGADKAAQMTKAHTQPAEER